MYLCYHIDPFILQRRTESKLLKLAGTLCVLVRQLRLPIPTSIIRPLDLQGSLFCPSRPFTTKSAACVPRVQPASAFQMGSLKILAHAASALKRLVCCPPKQGIPPPRRMHRGGEDVLALGFPLRRPVQPSVKGLVLRLTGRSLPESPVTHQHYVILMFCTVLYEVFQW